MHLHTPVARRQVPIEGFSIGLRSFYRVAERCSVGPEGYSKAPERLFKAPKSLSKPPKRLSKGLERFKIGSNRLSSGSFEPERPSDTCTTVYTMPMSVDNPRKQEAGIADYFREIATGRLFEVDVIGDFESTGHPPLKYGYAYKCTAKDNGEARDITSPQIGSEYVVVRG